MTGAGLLFIPISTAVSLYILHLYCFTLFSPLLHPGYNQLPLYYIIYIFYPYVELTLSCLYPPN